VVDGLLALIRSARQDLLVVSPYFVPGPEIMDAFRAARSKGVRIRVLTNSLASNDAPLAHAGYARHRKALLEMGIELHEMRSEAANVRSALRAGTTGSSGGSAGASRAMLHTKLLVIDGRLVAVGSMNLDMRSQLQNTEIAVLIASRRFSQLAGDSIDESLPENSWRVDLDPKGQAGLACAQDSGLRTPTRARCQPGTAPYAAAARASGSGQSALGVVCGQAHSCCRSRSGSACTQSLMAR
jgi:phosphatidylserine/phosphatidylglycerophosphate/cardiolipin synthase-like enzyme